MGRYRKPLPPGSPYITPEGEKSLRNELDFLWREERPIITQAVHEAAKNGDRSENGDYLYNKKRLREIDRRVRYLRKRLDELQVVNYLPDNKEKVYFGAWVDLENEEGEINQFRIVGSDEFDLDRGYLSMDAPLAKLLLGKTLDDEVSLEIQETKTRYTIINIEYDKTPD